MTGSLNNRQTCWQKDWLSDCQPTDWTAGRPDQPTDIRYSGKVILFSSGTSIQSSWCSMWLLYSWFGDVHVRSSQDHPYTFTERHRDCYGRYIYWFMLWAVLTNVFLHPHKKTHNLSEADVSAMNYPEWEMPKYIYTQHNIVFSDYSFQVIFVVALATDPSMMAWRHLLRYSERNDNTYYCVTLIMFQCSYKRWSVVQIFFSSPDICPNFIFHSRVCSFSFLFSIPSRPKTWNSISVFFLLQDFCCQRGPCADEPSCCRNKPKSKDDVSSKMLINSLYFFIRVTSLYHLYMYVSLLVRSHIAKQVIWGMIHVV